jgi:phage tail-like protein
MANQQPRAYAAAHFALELDGKDEVGLFRSIEGGSIKTDVMQYQNGANYDRWRQLGKPKFEDFKVQVGMAMSKPFYDWIAKFFGGEAERKTGAIVAADFYYLERARREFRGAMIKEMVFPKLDGQDKSAAYMNVSVAVEDMVFKKGTNKKLQQASGFNQQKLWTANNFRFQLEGFSAECRRVSKVDSFTVKQNIIEYHGGGMRAPLKCPSQIEFPNISFYVPEADSFRFVDHFKQHGVDGKAPGPLHGSIQTFDNDGRDMFTLAFTGAEICGVTPDKLDAGSEEIKQVKVDLYVEKMTFEYLAMQVE